MCCRQFPTFFSCMASFAMVALSGCYSMNGYMTNASGLSYYEQGNYAMAAQEFQTALASSPRNPDYIANLAKTKAKTGDAAAAEQLFQQALTLSPSHQPSYHGYAELLMAQNRSQEALRMLNAWAATQPYLPESHVELAWLQRELGQHDAAAQSLQTALQMNPNHATALAHLGQYHHDQGDAATAVALYQRALRSDWNQPEVHSRLAVAAQSAGAASPMAEMAMARGVHPNSLPRQQLAFGPPPAGLPQPGMPQQPTLAGHPYPHTHVAGMVQPGMPPHAASLAVNQSGLPQQSFTPVFPSGANAIAAGTGPFPIAGSGSFEASHPESSSMHPAMPSWNLSGGTAVSTHSSETLPAPIPDPAFSSHSSTAVASDIPVSSISHSQPAAESAPTVEAF